MRTRILLIYIIIILAPSLLEAQDITGLWKGTLYNDTTKLTLSYEIAISEEKGKLSGYSHTWFILENKQYFGLKKVKIKRSEGKILVEDVLLVANNYPEEPAKGVRQLNVLTLTVKDSIMDLSGPFSTNRTKKFRPLTGYVTLQRRNDYWQSSLVPHLQELRMEKDLSFVKEEEIYADNEKTTSQSNGDVAAVAKKKTTSQPNGEVVAVTKEKTTSQSNEEVAAVAKEKTTSQSNEEAVVVANEKARSQSNEEVAAVANEKTPSRSNEEAVAVANEKTLTRSNEKAVVVSNKKTGNDKSLADKKITNKKDTQVLPSGKLPDIPGKQTIAAEEVESRNTVVQQNVYFTNDSLQLFLYDNGEVDGDTVSVLMNGKVIIERQGLSTSAVQKTIYLPPGTDSLSLVMYAESLGSLPPNTGLLVVKEGKQIHEIRFSGDLHKNAAVVFRKRK